MNILTHITSGMRRARYGERLDPVRDWTVLITFSTLVLVGIVAWNVLVFDTVAQGGTIGTPASGTSVFDRASLDTVHTIFADRAAEEAKYATGAYAFTDPSL